MIKKNKKRIIGLMSGTSLDGLDVVCVDFWRQNDEITYKIIASHCYSYTTDWKYALKNSHLLSSFQLFALDAAYGNWLGQKILDFITTYKLKNIDFIGSHGHTVFHQPEKGFTIQIGNGSHIYAETGIKVVCDFRTQDVALGGQGAPLVPIGDELLFSAYDACVNLGGFANISFKENGQRVAFDICPVNFVLNRLSLETGKEFDKDGEIAKNHPINTALLHELNNLSFYSDSWPKSLGREWTELEVFPLFNKYPDSSEIKIATFTQHAAEQVAAVLHKYKLNQVLFTGGGALNRYLLKLIHTMHTGDIIIAEERLLHFKEALIFGLLAYLKSENNINVLASVTGARGNHSTGIIYE